jgi:hypothetical protein
VVDAARYLFALGEKGDAPPSEHADSTAETRADAFSPEKTDLNA